MHLQRLAFLLPALALVACAAPVAPAGSVDQAAASAELRAAETAFAASMARRDLAAFSALVADDAVFINGGQPLHGKARILDHWKRFFDGPQAPFSWKPELAEANLLGTMGYTRGPVSSPEGKVFAHFHSTWRRQPDGQWRVVFDNGERACDCAKP